MAQRDDIQQPTSEDRGAEARIGLIEQKPAGADTVIADAVSGDEILSTPDVVSGRREPSDADLNAIEADQASDEQRAISDAQLGEEIDALQAGGEADPGLRRDSSGLVVDEIAHERLEELTESGKEIGEVGILPQDPGQDDTSERLRENNPQDKRLPFGESEEDAVLPDAKLQEDDEGV